MASTTNDSPLLLVKKLGGTVLLLVGLLLTAVGFTTGPMALTYLGIVLLVAGAVLLALKVVRRNQGSV